MVPGSRFKPGIPNMKLGLPVRLINAGSGCFRIEYSTRTRKKLIQSIGDTLEGRECPVAR
jgi:hypothetical protein